MPLMSMLYLMFLFVSILISVSSSNWLMVWMMMEINLMMFIPLICAKKYLTDVSPSVKYFLAQVMGSLLLIFFVILSLMKAFNEMMFMTSSLFLLIAMAVKSGTPPFHFWFPQLMEMMNWVQMLILLTLQKVIPLIFLSYSMNSAVFLMMALISSLVGALGAFNQNSVKKIIAYSSMVHTSWIMLAMIFNLMLAMFYFILYCVINYVLVSLFKNSSMLSSDSFMKMLGTPQFNMLLCFSLLTISGLPPFSGFFMKSAVVVWAMNNLIVLSVAILFSLISVIYYTRLMFFFMLNSALTEKLKLNASLNPNVLVASTIILLNLTTPLIIFLVW